VLRRASTTSRAHTLSRAYLPARACGRAMAEGEVRGGDGRKMVRIERSGCRRWVEGGIISASELRAHRCVHTYVTSVRMRAYMRARVCTRVYTHVHAGEEEAR